MLKKISWQKKLVFFALIISLAPLIISDTNIISITKDELKSSTNNELISTANNLAEEINSFYKNNLLDYLLLIKIAVENEYLGANEKTSIMAAGIENKEDIVSLNLLFEVSPDNFVSALNVNKDKFLNKLKEQSLNPQEILQPDFNDLQNFKISPNSLTGKKYIKKIDTWLATVILPVDIKGSPDAYLYITVSLNKLSERIEEHPFNNNGKITLIDATGNPVFSEPGTAAEKSQIIEDSKKILKSNSRISGISNFKNENGENIVGCYAFPLNLDWAVIAEINEQRAYSAVNSIQNSLMVWLFIGLVIAFIGGGVFSKEISKPIQRISKAAEEISGGNFDVKIDYQAKDSIGVLAETLMKMSNSLKESFAKIEKQNRELEEYNRTLEDKVALRTEELNKSNVQLKQANDTLIELNNEKNEFLGIAAHDLKNPLVSIQGFSEIILMDNNLSRPEIEEFSKIIFDTSLRMFTIIKTLLDVNAIEEGKINLQIEEIDIKNNLNEVFAVNSDKAKNKNINLKLNVIGENTTAIADSNSMTQILDNLISNAVKFSPNDKNIFITMEQRDSFIRFTVKDEGPGLSDADKMKLFGKFAKLSARPTGGEHSTGLGLSIVKKLIEMMNGKVWCESELGKGASFIVEVPAANYI
ncbi:MAG: HAMP domain-containing protein [Bacteroidetes bacterium]|nr:HAMP domain-containing protein [Bacteroidota bacterium]